MKIIKLFHQKGFVDIVTLLGVLAILITIPITFKASQEKQDIRPFAEEPAEVCPPGCCGSCGTCPDGQSCDIPNGACSSGLSCNPQGYGHHKACQNNMCVEVPGAGGNDCESDDFCKLNQPIVCKKNECCGDGVRCNSTGTACNVTNSGCKVNETKKVCYPGNCCAEGKKCNTDGSACDIDDTKCTSTPPIITTTTACEERNCKDYLPDEWADRKYWSICTMNGDSIDECTRYSDPTCDPKTEIKTLINDYCTVTSDTVVCPAIGNQTIKGICYICTSPSQTNPPQCTTTCSPKTCKSKGYDSSIFFHEKCIDGDCTQYIAQDCTGNTIPDVKEYCLPTTPKTCSPVTCKSKGYDSSIFFHEKCIDGDCTQYIAQDCTGNTIPDVKEYCLPTIPKTPKVPILPEICGDEIFNPKTEVCDPKKNCITGKDGEGCAISCIGGYQNNGRYLKCKSDCSGYEDPSACYSMCRSNPTQAATEWGNASLFVGANCPGGKMDGVCQCVKDIVQPANCNPTPKSCLDYNKGGNNNSYYEYTDIKGDKTYFSTSTCISDTHISLSTYCAKSTVDPNEACKIVHCEGIDKTYYRKTTKPNIVGYPTLNECIGEVNEIKNASLYCLGVSSTQSTLNQNQPIVNPTSTLTGLIQGSIISNGTITIIDFAGKKYTAKTTQEGNFTLDVPTDKKYTVVIEAPNYKPFTFLWDPSDGKDYFSNIHLEKVTSPAQATFAITEKQITHHLIAGWNLISLSNNPSVPQTASTLINEINSRGGKATSVSKWENGEWVSFLPQIGKVDFPIEVGVAYFVQNEKETDFTIDGDEITQPTELNLKQGWNAVGFPKTSTCISTDCKAYFMLHIANLAKANSAGSIAEFTSGLWNTVLKEKDTYYGNDFIIQPGLGYFIKVIQPLKLLP